MFLCYFMSAFDNNSGNPVKYLFTFKLVENWATICIDTFLQTKQSAHTNDIYLIGISYISVLPKNMPP